MKRILLVGVVVLLSIPGTALRAQVLRTSVISGGASSAAGTGIVLKGTVGQPVIGRADAAVHAGLGFWYSVLANSLPSAADDVEQGPAEITLGAVSPNPFSTIAELPVTFRQSGFLTLTLFDISGRLLLTRNEGYRTPGTARFLIAADGLPSGKYLLLAQFNRMQKAIPLVVSK